MPRNPDQSQPGQEALIIANPETGDFAVRDLGEELAVNLEERRLHLLNALSLFSAINQRENFYSYQETAAQYRYKDRAEQVLEGSRRNRDSMVAEAKQEFGYAIGYYAVAGGAHLFPEFDMAGYKKQAERQWMQFQARYRSSDKSVARRDYKLELRQQHYDETNRRQTEFNRAHDLRPHISDKDSKRIRQETGKEYPILSTRERLQAIYDDSRAAFLPTTNREKNTVMTYLDYLDNPDYPLGVTNQLFEVFIHQQRLDKPKFTDTPEKRAEKRSRDRDGLRMATRALESITYELGDYMENARHSAQSLIELREFLWQPLSPRLAIGEEVPETEHGLRALIRYRDLARYRDKNEPPHRLGMDLLLTKENRIRKEAERTAADTGPNKTVEDIYTRSVQDPTVDGYIAETAESMTVKQARRLIDEAISDQQARFGFYQRELQGIAERAPQAHALTVARIASDILEGKIAS